MTTKVNPNEYKNSYKDTISIGDLVLAVPRGHGTPKLSLIRGINWKETDTN